MLTRLRDRRSTTLGAGRASKKGVLWGEGRGGLPGTGPGVVVRGRRRRRRRTGLGGAESEQGKSFPTPTPPRAAPVLVGVQVRNWPRPLKHLPCSLLVKRVLSLSDLFVNVVDCVGHHVRSGNKSKRLINTFCLWKKKKTLRDEEVGKSGTGSTKGRAAGGAGSGRRAASKAHAAHPERRRRPPARPGRGAARSWVRHRGQDGRCGVGRGERPRRPFPQKDEFRLYAAEPLALSLFSFLPLSPPGVTPGL